MDTCSLYFEAAQGLLFILAPTILASGMILGFMCAKLKPA